MKVVRARRAAGRRRLRTARRARPRARAASASRGAARRDARGGRLARASSRRCSRSSTRDAIRPLRVVVDAANGMAGAMLPPVLERLPGRGRALLLRARRHLPEPRAEPAPAREPRVHRRARRARRAPTSAWPTTATPTAASSSTTRASSSPATSSPRCWRQAILAAGAGREGASTTCARAARCPRRSRRPAACALVNRVGHAFIKHRMRQEDAVFAGEVSAPLLLPRLLAGRLGRGPVPAHARADLAQRAEAVRAARAVPRALLPHRRDQHARLGRGREDPGAEGALSRAEGGRISHLDGVSVDFDDWHFNVRPSNTEPLLRLNLEALSEPAHGAEARRGARADPLLKARAARRAPRPAPPAARSASRRAPARARAGRPGRSRRVYRSSVTPSRSPSTSRRSLSAPHQAFASSSPSTSSPAVACRARNASSRPATSPLRVMPA